MRLPTSEAMDSMLIAIWWDGDLGTVCIDGSFFGQNVPSMCGSSKVESIFGGTVEDPELSICSMCCFSKLCKGRSGFVGEICTGETLTSGCQCGVDECSIAECLPPHAAPSGLG